MIVIFILLILISIAVGGLWFFNRPVKVWSEWSKCDKDCAGGTQFKTCNQAKTLFSKEQDCGKEERECNTHECPIDGVLGDWGEWTDCPKCSNDEENNKTRTRLYTEPQHGGSNPEGYEVLTETDKCAPVNPCDIVIKPTDSTLNGLLVTSTNNKSYTLKDSQGRNWYTLKSSDLAKETIKEAVAFNKHPSNFIEYKFNIVKDGTYIISLRHKNTGSGHGDSVYIKLDKGSNQTWHLSRSKTWRTNETSRKFTKGSHIIRISAREVGVAINSVTIKYKN